MIPPRGDHVCGGRWDCGPSLELKKSWKEVASAASFFFCDNATQTERIAMPEDGEDDDERDDERVTKASELEICNADKPVNDDACQLI